MGDIGLFPLFAPVMNKKMKVAAVCLTDKHPEPARKFTLSARAGGGGSTKKLVPVFREVAAMDVHPCTDHPRVWEGPFAGWAGLFPAIIRNKRLIEIGQR